MPTAAQPWQYNQQSDQDKALAKDWLKRIEAAGDRPGIKDAVKKFERNRKLLRGMDPDDSDKKFRANLFYAELARMRPQVYAKDPEFAISPSRGVPADRQEAVQRFSDTAGLVLEELLVRQAKLKKRAKRLLTAAFTTSVGWWKVQWQSQPRVDTLIENRIKDTQDNLARLQAERDRLEDPSSGGDVDAQLGSLREMLAGLQAQAEVSVANGVVIDFVLSEDIRILDESVRELGDYERASAMAHRVWMTRKKYRETFGHPAPDKAKSFREAKEGISAASSTDTDKESDLLAVWEVWDQDSNRVLHVVEGGEGFCRPPGTPDWTGERWYPFFALAWNDADGCFFPLSDIELVEPLVREYNDSRDDQVQDRKDARPVTIVRKGGSLTPDDVQRIRNRNGNDIITVEGVGQQPIANDIQALTFGNLNPAVYDTSPARADIEQILGGGDAARGSVLKAKTATEAEILAQGLRGRNAERTDIMEDLLSDVGNYALEILLRKMSPAEVERIAGPDGAASWPSLSWQEALQQVTVTVRGGSTGKPDRLQEQDRWTKLMPVIKETIAQVAELRAKGQHDMAAALINLTRETLRRFDERVDIDQFLPPEGEDGAPDPAKLLAENQMLKQKGQELMAELDKLKDSQEKGYISAAASIATSAQPLMAAAAFGQAMAALEAKENAEKSQGELPEDPNTDAPAMTGAQFNQPIQ